MDKTTLPRDKMGDRNIEVFVKFKYWTQNFQRKKTIKKWENPYSKEGKQCQGN